MRKLPIKPLMIAATILHTSCSMYAGAVSGFKNRIYQISDMITGTTTAPDHAPLMLLKIETEVNEHGQRENYLVFEDSIRTPIDDLGYAFPKDAESILHYLQRSSR